MMGASLGSMIAMEKMGKLSGGSGGLIVQVTIFILTILIVQVKTRCFDSQIVKCFTLCDTGCIVTSRVGSSLVHKKLLGTFTSK